MDATHPAFPAHCAGQSHSGLQLGIRSSTEALAAQHLMGRFQQPPARQGLDGDCTGQAANQTPMAGLGAGARFSLTIE
jgi:hypothetical protein